MHALAGLRPHACARSRRAVVSNPAATRCRVRAYSEAAPQRQQQQQQQQKDGDGLGKAGQTEEGALTRRLREMSEDALTSGGHNPRKTLDEAGFSAELKAQLEQRIAAATLRSSEADLPASASRHTRDLAAAEAWTGTESIHDASLRMLNDAHKPMRLGRPPKSPGVQPPQSIDTGHKRGKDGRGLRLANARDRSTVYASLKEDLDLEAADREKRLQELKDRFDPGTRAIVPGTIQGLASLANKRIEDAIARGQFKNLPRGKGKNVERDYNASSPFIDTTEYFMNKIIQKQDIVPPWIEKQQELTAAANKFRSRLRTEWKRHAARMIASKGGPLVDQIRRAEAYARAELRTNPLRKKEEKLATVDDEGHVSQISLSGELKVNTIGSSDTNTIITDEIHVKETPLTTSSEPVSPTAQPAQTITIPISHPLPTAPTASHPFRDPEWERIEHAYLSIAIQDLNTKARSYNLQAPELAKRPYYNLQRELNACYADVAPQLAGAILDRARRPAQKVESWSTGGRERSVLDAIVGGPVRVRDERREKQYGFRQFWKDLWVRREY